MADEWLVLLESNTTGSGRLFCATARQMGLRPILLSRDPGRYPYVETDRIDNIAVDTGDLDTVGAVCAGLGGRIAGVTSSSEYFIAKAAVLARSAGLPYPVPEAVTAAQDKAVLRSRLRQAGLPSPPSGLAATPDEAVDIARRIGFPVVVKPVVGSGSVGVRRCADAVEVKSATADVLDAVPTAVHVPSSDAVLVEGYLNGPEYSVETFDEQVVGVTAKHLGQEPHFVETGHDFPAALPDSAVADAAVAALRAVGLGWGAAHVEVRLTSSGPCVVEINPRLAGGMIPRVVQEATGVDLIACVVAKAVGRKPPLSADRARHAAIRFLLADRSGALLAVQGTQRAAGVPGVVEVGVVRPAGQVITIDHSFRDRLAYVIAVSDDDCAKAAADAGLRTLTAEISASPDTARF
jgi:biotin carboxylase